MGLGKRVARSRFATAAMPWAFARYVGFVYATSRWQTQGREGAAALLRAGRPFIVAFWHGRLMMAPTAWREDTAMHVMISRHRDGEKVARAARHLGIATVRGSRTRGGAAALRASLRVLKEGGCLSITPDGPRGPRMRVQPGIITLARLAGAPIVPMTCAVSRRLLADSWDRFVIALPFSKGACLWGAPLYVAADADEAARETARLTLEARLNEMTAAADRLVGAAPVAPAAPAAPHRGGTVRAPTAAGAG